MKTKILKTFFCVVLSMLVSFVSAGCAQNKGLPINNIVAEILAENDIVNSKITFLVKPNDELAELYDYKNVEITDEELKEYVDDLLLSHEKMIEIKERNTVQKGDAIVVSYVVRHNGEIVANTDKDALLVGSGKYWKEFEEAVVGAVVGEPFVFELKSPADTEKYKSGEALQYNVTVQSINYFEAYTPSDRYILDYYGCKTEDEFLENCKITLEQIKKYENRNSADIDFLNAIADKCKFYIDKDEAVAYGKKIVDYHKDMAYINGLELSEYIKQILNMTEDEFYDYCYDEGVKEIKQYFIVGASTNEADCSSEDYREFCTMSGYDSAQDEIGQKYDYLKTITPMTYRQVALRAAASLVVFNDNKANDVEIYDSSNIRTINFSADQEYHLTSEKEQAVLTALENIKFAETRFNTSNQFYQKILIVKEKGEIAESFFIDEVNGYLKRQLKDGTVVYARLDASFLELIKK